LEIGDVGVVELRDVRDHHPVAREVGAGNLLDPRDRLRLDRSEFREVHARPWQQIQCAAAGDAACAGSAGCGRGERALDELLHIVVDDPALRPAARYAAELDAELARELAYRR